MKYNVEFSDVKTGTIILEKTIIKVMKHRRCLICRVETNYVDAVRHLPVCSDECSKKISSMFSKHYKEKRKEENERLKQDDEKRNWVNI